MEINDVIKQVATYLQMSNVTGANLENVENLDTQTVRDINLILSCINEVLCDISTDYLPLKASEEITVLNGEFSLSGLSQDFHKLISISPNLPHVIRQNTLYVDSGTYSVEYQYLPEVYEVGDTIEDFDTRLTIYALSFGVAAEFCLISGNYSESEMWNSRFESAMQVAKRRNLVNLKGRKWLWKKPNIQRPQL